ncbi:glycine cleavage system protein GcvH [Solidesulfovibrio sp.]|jgi:glycine cleavage system H protein|uniref:glycine cleavage system protein GcvH n=1 Tax=Solidesulfovibrio sp. TaxID=2910990 RepID=UPI002B2041B7|nr:glycine cleavage system protein GcvH [Solidesulfovibrio sp.]MEA5090832.1 glycine cleavage system protein GcvH [Solidesulfovibrio sp.]HML61484.1 glycine cleavage system protein GcvH [Solidesulfovibrio sp.]
MQKDLLYTNTHEWVRVEDEIAVIGITDFAQEQLGDITYVELPAVGDVLEAGQEMGSVESVKAASELYCPVSGEVIEVNDELESAPEKVNSDPFGEGWMLRIKLSAEPVGLLSPEEYEEIAKSEH